MRRKRITVLGTFTILALGGLTFAALALRFQPIGAHTEWTVYLAEDSAIDKGARVFTSGFKVGFVSKVELMPLEEIFVVETLEVAGLAEGAADDGKDVYMTRTGSYTLKDPQYGKAVGQITSKGERGTGTAAVRLNGRYIRATLSVDPEVNLWQGARVVLARGTLLSRHSVNLLRGTPRHGAELKAGPGQPLYGEVEAGVMEKIKRFVDSNENDVHEVIVSVKETLQPLRHIARNHQEGALGHMLLDNATYGAMSDLFQTIKNQKDQPRTLLARLIYDEELGAKLARLGDLADSLTTDYEGGQGLLQALLSDSEMRRNFESFARNIETITKSLENAESGGILAGLIHNKEERERFSEDLVQIHETIADLRKVSAQLNDTKGPLGMLLNDESAREELREFVKQITKVGKQLSSVEGSTLGRLINDDRIIRDLEAMISEFREAGQVARENAPLGSLTSFTVLFFDVLN